MAKRQNIYDLRYTIDAHVDGRKRLANLPLERGLQPASMPICQDTLKRHECRAPRIGRS
jgi:hypothetical protein